MVEMYKLYHQIQPAMAYHVTMKPVIYGSIISRILKIKTIDLQFNKLKNISFSAKSIGRKFIIANLNHQSNQKLKQKMI